MRRWPFAPGPRAPPRLARNRRNAQKVRGPARRDSSAASRRGELRHPGNRFAQQAREGLFDRRHPPAEADGFGRRPAKVIGAQARLDPLTAQLPDKRSRRSSRASALTESPRTLGRRQEQPMRKGEIRAADARRSGRARAGCACGQRTHAGAAFRGRSEPASASSPLKQSSQIPAGTCTAWDARVVLPKGERVVPNALARLATSLSALGGQRAPPLAQAGSDSCASWVQRRCK